MSNQSSKYSSRISRLTTPLLSALRGLLNVGLLGLPVYLESQGRGIFEEAERCIDLYDEWNQNQESIVTPIGEQQRTYTISNSHQRGGGANLHTTLPISSLQSDPMPKPVMVLVHKWSGFVGRRETEWSFFFLPISLVFVNNAPSIFQFPGANDNTFTRSFTALAIFRAMSSLFYIVFFHVHVQDRIKDVRFIMEHLFTKKTGARMMLSAWIILSFPAAATGWTALLYMCAVTSFILSGGGTITTSPLVEARLSPTVIFLVGTMVDFLCMVWIVVALWGYGKASQDEKHAGVLRDISRRLPAGGLDKACDAVQV